jgi:2'-5' RNA ligase
MRLFTAIDPPGPVLENLERLLTLLRPAAQLKWGPVYNLHITTKFIGEWPEERLPEMIETLRSVPQPQAPIEIEIRGLGWFPNPHHPRVFFAAVHAPAALAELAQAIDRALAKLGVPAEDSPYSPHLTLARIKSPAPLTALREAVANLESVEFGSFQARTFHLYRSQPGAAGSVYKKLAEFPLLPQ